MKLLVFMLMTFFINAADINSFQIPESLKMTDMQPLQIPQSFKPYADLIEALYTTKGLTLEGAIRMVEPLADKLAKLREDPQAPNLLFLIKQKKVFEAEEERLKSLCEQDPKNMILEKAYFLIRHSRKACEDCTLTPEDIEKRKIEDEKK